MKLFGGIALAIAGLLLQPAAAHSRERNPLRNVGHIQRPTLLTPSNRVHAFSSYDLTFSLSDSRASVRLSLEPNHDVLADGATVTYLADDGTVRSSEPINRLEHRIFRGNAFVQYPGDTEWLNVGWARIHVHRDGQNPLFEGAFQIYGNHHHVQTSQHYRQTSIRGDPILKQGPDDSMVFWRDSDIIEDYHGDHGLDELKRGLSARDSCTASELLFNRDENHPVYRSLASDPLEKDSFWATVSPRTLFGRQMDGTTGGNGAAVNLASTIGSTQGCPTSRKVALIGIATDCTYTADFANETAVRTNIISQVNTASQLYESTFNISLGIQNLTVSSANCPSTASTEAPWNVGCSDSVDITDRLNLFSQWRGQHQDTNAYWTLLSTCNTGSAVGLAWLGQLCTPGSSSESNETVAGANVVVRTSTEWQVFAHESGHTFGAVHDCTSTTCSDGTSTRQQCCPLSSSSCDANGQYLMNPSTASGITAFSPCSIGNICSALGGQSVKSSCLTNNKDVVTITGSQCGNGIVEAGEDCDCGGDSGCSDNACCDAATCKFTSGSVCDPSNEQCCTGQCQYAGSGTVCRASTGVCDPDETCTGTAGDCPVDQKAADGTGCGSGLECASGQCTSRDQQCQSLLGSLTTDNDTQACESSGCQISCQSPQFGDNVCYRLNQNFLDGTSCQGGGKCENGACTGASATEEIKSWIQDNKDIVIPVAVVVGLIVILGIASCIGAIIRRSRRSKRRAARRVPKPTGFGYVPPPPAGPRSGSGSSGPRSHRSRSDRGMPPNMPAPAYQGQGWQQPSMSMRYA